MHPSIYLVYDGAESTCKYSLFPFSCRVAYVLNGVFFLRRKKRERRMLLSKLVCGSMNDANGDRKYAFHALLSENLQKWSGRVIIISSLEDVFTHAADATRRFSLLGILFSLPFLDYFK